MFRTLGEKLRNAVLGKEIDARLTSREPAPPVRVSGGRPEEFFPTAIGTTWRYRIHIGNAEPLIFRETLWPQPGGGSIGTATRGRFGALFRERRRDFTLELQVTQRAAWQGPLNWPDGVQLTVVKDDLGIYDEHQDLFWAITAADRFTAIEVVTYPPHIAGAPSGPWGRIGGDGHTLRPRYFGGDPGGRIGLGEDPTETLRYEGSDERRARQWNTPVKRFVRQIQAGEQRPHEDRDSLRLSSGFEETMWFGLGRGLVELEQIVAGDVTMHWELQR